MNIAIIGATGTLGQRITAEALRRGHRVTALVRDPSKVESGNDALGAKATNILDSQSVAEGVQGHDAVISAYGPRGEEGTQSVVASAKALIEGLLRANVRRIIIVGGAGSLEVAPGVQLVDSPEFPESWKGVALAHREVLEIFRAEAGELEWTYFSPSALIEPGERTGQFRLGADTLLTDAQGQSRISAEDFAIAVVDETEQAKHLRQRITAGY